MVCHSDYEHNLKTVDTEDKASSKAIITSSTDYHLSLDAIEPRLEVELSPADNLMAIETISPLAPFSADGTNETGATAATAATAAI